MNTTIAVLGATGVFGRHLTPRLVAAGHQVRALVRRTEAAGLARGCGAEIGVADIFDIDVLVAALQGCEMVINLATSLPGPSGRGDFAANDRLRRDGTPILVEACKRAGVQRLLQQSIAMVRGAGDTLVDEDTPPTPAASLTSSPRSHPASNPASNPVAEAANDAALALEACVRGSGLDWVIVRGGLFYGPGTGFDDDWFARAVAGKLRVPGDGDDFVSLVHIADMAAATLAVVEAWPARQVLIIADDMPARWRDVFAYVAAVAGAPAPMSGGRPGFASFRVSNRKARALLGWTPLYRDFRAGLAR